MNNKKDLRFVIKEIEDYYYINTDLGRREVALSLLPNEIVLESNFPYFDYGIRGINYNRELDSYSVYVDVKFLFTDLYNEVSKNSYFELDAFRVISNELNLENKVINFSNQLRFEVNLEGFTYLCDKSQYFLIELSNPLIYKLNLKLLPKVFSLYHSIHNSTNLDYEIDIISMLSEQLKDNILATIKFTHCTCSDKMALMNYFKVISKLFNKPKLVFSHNYHGTFINFTYREVLRLKKLFSSVNL